MLELDAQFFSLTSFIQQVFAGSIFQGAGLGHTAYISPQNSNVEFSGILPSISKIILPCGLWLVFGLWQNVFFDGAALDLGRDDDENEREK